jgi:hypothetical protein
MKLRPSHHQPKLPDLEVAVDHLDLIKAHLRARAGVPRTTVRETVVIEEHHNYDPGEAADRWHSTDAVAPAGSEGASAVVGGATSSPTEPR